ncbi:beta-glucosidase-like SFR2, chloroplastic isoform X2 [Musa acuminata AAA Group]|uniref:beta-glucosidase-like SFR2, chloroplastic isoform X2 n=1 Tax=Musa acuminata AAA Group TaxID=214697 RepID=UPI0031E2FB2A
MASVALFLTATKVAGALVLATVAANALSFFRYRRRYLRPFRSPIDESSDVLADFNVLPSGEVDGFFFGLATAPAHVEDRLRDAWLQFAEEQPCADVGLAQKHPVDALLASATGDGGSQQGSLATDESKKTGILETKKPLKIAMEAMIRGFVKYSDDEGLNSDTECHRTVASWHNVPHPQERLRFWSDPDTELKLAKDTGVSVFRMGIDWSRIMPREPIQGLKDAVNFAALERYRWIIKRVHFYGMKVMLTLFHHSLPPWAGEYGGWKLEKTVDYFMDFTRLVVDRVADLVDYWVTFNEPHVFVLLTYCAGAWPGGNPDMIEVATSALPTGVFNQAMHWMAVAHTRAYDYIHGERSVMKPSVGIAHHVSFTRPYGLFDVAAVTLANSLIIFPYVDSICDKLDFIGINYYGQVSTIIILILRKEMHEQSITGSFSIIQEVISAPGLKLVENDEYSESGRAVYPDGLYQTLLQFHERYKRLSLPFIITENGVSDETDLIRRPYLLEHLLAVYAAILMGVRVLGYLFWTISDNWEWADGYGPKFGLVAVDRANDLARNPRPSYYLFSKVVKTGQITKLDRMHAWKELQHAAKGKKTRPFYRKVDKHGLMYAGGLDEPIQRPYVRRDWRFGHYELDGLQDPLSRLWNFVTVPFSPKKKVELEDPLVAPLPAGL